jgi:phosphohistidine swiveling domain-containing protein
VILRAEQLGQLEPGDILVAPTTSPSWTPVFGTIAAAVLDTGGIMSHAAIIAREYGLPAVVGTGTATKRIRTGDRLRVDGGNGRVTILQVRFRSLRLATARYETFGPNRAKVRLHRRTVLGRHGLRLVPPNAATRASNPLVTFDRLARSWLG